MTCNSYSMEQSPYWEADRYSASPDIPDFRGTQRFITMSQEPITGPCSEPDEFNPVHILTPYFLNIILPSMSRFYQVSYSTQSGNFWIRPRLGLSAAWGASTEPTYRGPSRSSTSRIWSHIRSLMMMTETSVQYRHLTRLIAREHLIKSTPASFCHWHPGKETRYLGIGVLLGPTKFPTGKNNNYNDDIIIIIIIIIIEADTP